MHKILMRHRKKTLFVIALILVEVFLISFYRNNSRSIFYKTAEYQLNNFTKMVKRDVNRILYSDKKFIPELINNFQSKPKTVQSTKIPQINNDYIEIYSENRQLKIDISDIKHLFENIFHDHYSFVFINDLKSQPGFFMQKEVYEGLYVAYRLDQNYVAQVYGQIDKNLMLLFVIINVICAVVYFYFRKNIFKRAVKLRSKNNRLSKLESYKKAEYKLSQILKTEFENKLKYILRLEDNVVTQEVLTLARRYADKVNINTMLSLLREYYFDIQFYCMFKTDKTVSIPISLPSFYQLVFSIIDSQAQVISKEREVSIRFDQSDEELSVSIISKVSKYFRSGDDVERVKLSHPLFINVLKNKKLLNSSGVEVSQYVKNDMHQVDIILSKKVNKKSTDNVCQISRFK